MFAAVGIDLGVSTAAPVTKVLRVEAYCEASGIVMGSAALPRGVLCRAETTTCVQPPKFVGGPTVVAVIWSEMLAGS